MIDKANARTVREAIEAALNDGVPSMLQGDARPDMATTEALEFAARLLHERGANLRLFTKRPWLHIEPFGQSEGTDPS